MCPPASCGSPKDDFIYISSSASPTDQVVPSSVEEGAEALESPTRRSCRTNLSPYQRALMAREAESVEETDGVEEDEHGDEYEHEYEMSYENSEDELERSPSKRSRTKAPGQGSKPDSSRKRPAIGEPLPRRTQRRKVVEESSPDSVGSASPELPGSAPVREGFRISLSSSRGTEDSATSENEFEASKPPDEEGGNSRWISGAGERFDQIRIGLDVQEWERRTAQSEAHVLVIDVDGDKRTLVDLVIQLRAYIKACRSSRIRPQENSPIPYLILNYVPPSSATDCCAMSLRQDDPVSVEDVLEETSFSDDKGGRTEWLNSFMSEAYVHIDQLESKGKRKSPQGQLSQLAECIHELGCIPHSYSSIMRHEGLRVVVFIGFVPCLTLEFLLRYIKNSAESPGINTRIVYQCAYRQPNACLVSRTYEQRTSRALELLEKEILLQENEKDDEEDDDTCRICMVDNWNTVILPCGHGGVCHSCAKELLWKFGKCPICRVEVTEIVEIANTDSNT